MAEMLKSEHEALSSGTWTPGNFLGSNPAEWDGLYAPARDAQTSGAWDSQAADMLDSVMRRLWNACGLYVYKDSTDTALQYSVTDGDVWAGGGLWSYAGQVNRGPLTASSANYIYLTLGLSGGALTLSVTSSTSGWPSTPHVRLDVITPPSSGHWKDQHRARHVRSQAVTAPLTGVYSIQSEFAYNTSSPLTIGVVPNGAWPLRATIKIKTAFNAGTPTLKIGDAGDDDRLMTTAQNNPLVAGSYVTNPAYEYSAHTALTLTIVPSSASAGAGLACVEYVL